MQNQLGGGPTISFFCYRCGDNIIAQHEQRGMLVQCEKCLSMIAVPELDQETQQSTAETSEGSSSLDNSPPTKPAWWQSRLDVLVCSNIVLSLLIFFAYEFKSAPKLYFTEPNIPVMIFQPFFLGGLFGTVYGIVGLLFKKAFFRSVLSCIEIFHLLVVVWRVVMLAAFIVA